MHTILGAGGAIGIELAKALATYHKPIRLVSRNPKPVQPTDQLFTADLSQKNQVKEAVKGSDVVYLTVGLPYSTKVWERDWIPLMENVLEACIENQAKLVFFDNVYMIGGNQVNHITEDSPFSPVSRKGKVREALDKMVIDSVDKGKLQAIIARAADFYGRVIEKSLLVEMIHKNLALKKAPQWLCNGKVKHSFTFTPDAGKATAMLGNTPEAFDQIWNLPTDPTPLSGEDWASLFEQAMGVPHKKLQVLPKIGLKVLGWFVPVMGEFYEMAYQYDRDYFFDSAKFCKAFNFTPTVPKEGIRQTVEALQ